MTDLTTMSPDEQSVLDKTMRCGICHGAICSRVKMLMCMHMVCDSCARKPEVGKKAECPVCHVNQPFLVEAAPRITSERVQSELITSHRPDPATGRLSDEDLRSQLRIQSGFGTKIDAIVLDLLRTDVKECPRWVGNASPAKSVVFSEWVDLLKTLAVAWERNGVVYLDMTSRTAKTKVNGISVIDRFIHDPDCMVCVYPLV